MRVRNSLRSAKVRDKNCRVVRRRGRVYVINKTNPRLKCRQGSFARQPGPFRGRLLSIVASFRSDPALIAGA